MTDKPITYLLDWSESPIKDTNENPNPGGIYDTVIKMTKAVGAIAKTHSFKGGGGNFKHAKAEEVVSRVREVICEHEVCVLFRTINRALSEKEVITHGGDRKTQYQCDIRIAFRYRGRDGSETEEYIVDGSAADYKNACTRMAYTYAWRAFFVLSLSIALVDESYNPDDENRRAPQPENKNQPRTKNMTPEQEIAFEKCFRSKHIPKETQDEAKAWLNDGVHSTKEIEATLNVLKEIHNKSLEKKDAEKKDADSVKDIEEPQQDSDIQGPPEWQMDHIHTMDILATNAQHIMDMKAVDFYIDGKDAGDLSQSMAATQMATFKTAIKDNVIKIIKESYGKEVKAPVKFLNSISAGHFTVEIGTMDLEEFEKFIEDIRRKNFALINDKT